MTQCWTSKTSTDEVIGYVLDRNLELKWILETQAHAAHLSAVLYLKEKLGVCLSANLAHYNNSYGSSGDKVDE